MPSNTPGTSYTGKPVRRLKLPKIGPAKTTSLFEEYFYILLAVAFFAVTIFGKAGGFGTYNAVVIGAWVTAMLWCGHQLKDYFAEKSKRENGKTPAPPPQTRAEKPKRPVPLPAGMKPMIGPQWPVKSGARTSWPKLPKQAPAAAPAPASQTSAVQTSTVPTNGSTTETASSEKKRAFVYERPTLPDRKPKLPCNWTHLNDKKRSDKKRDSKKPKQ